MADVKWIKITTDIFDDEKVLMHSRSDSRTGLSFIALVPLRYLDGPF